MKHGVSDWLIWLLPLALSLDLGGCSSASPLAVNEFRSDYAVAADRTLQYRVPLGWLDASADSQAVGHVVWLVRNDYGASIAVDRLYLNDDARAALAGNGLLELAGLQIGLVSSSMPVEVTEQPVLRRVNGKKLCVYSLRMTPGGDVKRTILVSAGSALYAVHAFVAAQNGANDAEKVHALQGSFVTLLRW
jgi:hypothetical protein